ncbi:MAG: hypothetical protein HZA88_15090 [Verrucomicrobia bacterium]|nr:hypothetical protein [Verrucomicrobiota bacterium]
MPETEKSGIVIPAEQSASRLAGLGIFGRMIVSGVMLFVACAFFLYPGIVTFRVATDPELRTTGQTRLLRGWFSDAARRYDRWATQYLDSHRGELVSEHDVAGTEWPIFGSTLFLLAAEELFTSGKTFEPMNSDVVSAVRKAAQVIADPATGSWVRRKWGADYLTRENVFYRMLLIMGFAAYERLTPDRQYHDFMTRQMRSLADELQRAPFHLCDDYPGECYPHDVLWAVAALQRAGRLDGVRHDALIRGLMSVLNGKLRTPHDLPASEASSRTGSILQGARGCNSSGILIVAAELDKQAARQWFEAYVRHFWDSGTWVAGFRETPRGGDDRFMDVDSGLVVGGLGSVASAFGIGAAKVVGRFDHAAPLTMEAVAVSWPSPFGPVIPGILGSTAAGGWCLGESALLFSMSRRSPSDAGIPFTGPVPRMVWVVTIAYFACGLLLIVGEVRGWMRWARKHRKEAKLANNEVQAPG